MSIIVVNQIPFRCSIGHAIKLILKTNCIAGRFVALKMETVPKTNKKLLYVRLPPGQDPLDAVNKIKMNTRFGAYIPRNIPPNLPNDASISTQKKEKKLLLKDNPKIVKMDPHQALVLTHTEILTEMQSKFSGLYNLSKRTGHKLLENIARTLFERLRTIIDGGAEAAHSVALSRSYRRLHPHFGDFQLILSTLHALQDAAGSPRAQLNEAELTKAPVPTVDKVPFTKMQSICQKYSERIVKKVLAHVSQAPAEGGGGGADAEQRARAQVRAQLKKMTNYLPVIVKEVIINHFIPQKAPFAKVRMYGEPCLPPKEQLTPLLRRHGARAPAAPRCFNLLRLAVPPTLLPGLLALDHTCLGGNKLIVRQLDIPMYKPSRQLMSEMRAMFGVPDDAQELVVDEDWTQDVELADQ